VLKHRIPDGVTVLREYAADTPDIEAIAAELNQVWTNLISNALDAMAGTGTLRISTRAERGGVAGRGGGHRRVGRTPGPRTARSSPSSPPRGSARARVWGWTSPGASSSGRHSGDITIDLRPGETVLRVWLPSRHESAPT
jgi:nitrogen-specific signal transduction histidine kinase